MTNPCQGVYPVLNKELFPFRENFYATCQTNHVIRRTTQCNATKTDILCSVPISTKRRRNRFLEITKRVIQDFFHRKHISMIYK